MQLGTRWPVGGTAPDRLPAAVIAAITATEAEVSHLDTSRWRWTLTWLESKPVVELDDGTVIRYDTSTDTATTLPPPDDEA